MNVRLLCLIFSLGVIALADHLTDTRSLSGTWVVEGDAGRDGTTSWVLEGTPESLKITRIGGTGKVAELECNTSGRECEFSDSGKPAKVSLWFLGPKLVQMETKGSEVIKRRFSVADDVMQVEFIPISPGSKPDSAKFRRVQTGAHAN